MRVIKLALLSFVFFFGLITVMSLFIPAHVRISRAINIATADSVLYLVATHNQWPRWHPLFKNSNAPGLLQKYNFTLNTIEASDSTVRVAWMQPGKAPILNGWQLYRFSTSDSLALHWYMDFRIKWYPWQKFSSLFYESTYGPLMEQGLKNIKTVVQARKELDK